MASSIAETVPVLAGPRRHWSQLTREPCREPSRRRPGTAFRAARAARPLGQQVWPFFSTRQGRFSLDCTHAAGLFSLGCGLFSPDCAVLPRKRPGAESSPKNKKSRKNVFFAKNVFFCDELPALLVEKRDLSGLFFFELQKFCGRPG